MSRQLRCIEHPELQFRITLAETFLSRLLGLLTTRSAPALGEGLLIKPGGSVHAFGMREAIDVIYLDRQLSVIRHRKLRPWQFAIAPSKTFATLEIACNQITTPIIGCHFTEETPCQFDPLCTTKPA